MEIYRMHKPSVFTCSM